MDDLKNKRVTVLGLGRFGGGIAVARWLCEQGAKVLVTDRDPIEKLKDSVKQLDDLPLQFRLGIQCTSDFTECDLLVTSPAVKPASELLEIARENNVPITTEICLFASRCRGKVFGVTGTKGKSTTSSLLGEMLRTTGKPVFLGGNIGKSLLAELPKIDESSLVVLELSSYMLHWLGAMNWSPSVAVVTMLGTDHLDWHGGAEGYIGAKRHITAHQMPGDVLVRRDDAISRTFTAPAGVQVIAYPDSSVPAFDLLLPGEHNQVNAQAAFLAAQTVGVFHAQAQEAVGAFRGLPHRLELVHEANGVRYYNDSIATIPEAAIVANGAFTSGKVIQIIGGSRKEGLDWSEMCKVLSRTCKKVLAIGEIGQELAKQCSNAEYVGTLESAIDRAREIAEPGDVVLLSPATASYDQFANFELRGKRFGELAMGQKA